MAGTPLTGNTVASSYAGLLKTTDSATLDGTLRKVSDGLGVESALQVSTAGVKSSGTLEVAGATTLTGDLTLTAQSAAAAKLARVQLNKGETTLTDAATIATDASLGNVFTVTLGGNRTLGAPTNLVAGATYIWRFTQDGTGSRTLAYNAVFKWQGGVAPTLTTTAAAIDLIMGVSNGTNIYCTAMLDVR